MGCGWQPASAAATICTRPHSARRSWLSCRPPSGTTCWTCLVACPRARNGPSPTRPDSAPIFDHRGAVAGAISVSAPDSRLDDARAAEVAVTVIEQAAAVTRRLGGVLTQTAGPL